MNTRFIQTLTSEIKNYIKQNERWPWKNIDKARAYLSQINCSAKVEDEKTIFKKVAEDYLGSALKEGPFAKSTDLRERIGKALREGLEIKDTDFEDQVSKQIISTALTVFQSEASLRFTLTKGLLAYHGYAVAHTSAPIELARQAQGKG